MIPYQRKLYYLDAPAGAGKTHSLVRHAHRLARLGQKVLVVQPSMDLIDQTVTTELEKLSKVRHRRIHRRTNPGEVIAEIVKHFKETADGGEILFITHAAFLMAPYFENRDAWVVIIDEALQADQFAEHNIPETHDLIVPYIDIEPFDARYGLASPVDSSARSALREIAFNKKRDEVWSLFEGFAARVISEHWSVYVLENQFENLKAGEGKRRRLLSYSLLEPTVCEGFKKVIVAGACFEDTLLYILWLAQGVEFEPMELPLRYKRHDNGSLTRILYATEEAWSKKLRDRPSGSESDSGEAMTVLKKVIEATRSEIGAEPFIWMGNKDLSDGIFELAGARRLPNTPHGRNDFQDAHIAVVLSALNPPPAHFSFLDARGVDGEQVRTSLYRSAVYQAVMRCSIRNPKDQTPKTIIVMDATTAHWLADLFPGAEVAALPGVDVGTVRGRPGRPLLHKTSAARQAAHRRKCETELLIEQEVINGSDLATEDYPDLADEVRARMTEIPCLGDPTVPAESAGTAFASIYSPDALAHIDYGDDDTFIEGLRQVHRDVIEQKEEAGLISPAHFDSEMSNDTSRGLANVRYLRGVWLDNDGGDLSHEHFARLFPRLRIVVFNTFSSTPEKPRWRAFIPTTQAMSMRVHRIILDQIIRVLNREGYWSPEQLAKNTRIRRRRTHGFDLSKLTASSLFFLPAQARHPRGSFFIDHTGEGRRAIEPCQWIKNSIIHTSPEPDIQPTVSQTGRPATCGGGPEKLRAIRESLQAQSSRRNSEAEGEAIARWREVAWQKGQGHDAFFKLAAGLWRLGVVGAELRQTLNEEAGYARSPADRRREIKNILRSLAKG